MTTRDNQDKITINVRQGENEVASSNLSLGKFIIPNIPAGQAMEHKFDVTFDITENHTLKVTAVKLCDGKQESIEVNR